MSIQIKIKQKVVGWMVEYRRYIIIMGIFFIAFGLLQAINKRFWLHDFQVYYFAAQNYFAGENVYGILYILGSGYFKYSPFALLLFYPLSVLPLEMARILYFAFLASLILVTVPVSDRLVNDKLLRNEGTPRLTILFLITLAFLQHIYFELHLGNINILLLLLSLVALRLMLNHHEGYAGMLIALAILIKVHFVILVPLLLLRRRFKAALAVFGGVAAGLLIPALYSGFNANLVLLREWINTMLIHNSDAVNGQDTIYAWLYRLTGRSITAGSEWIFILTVLSTIAMLMLTMVMIHYRSESRTVNAGSDVEKNQVFEYLVLIAIIPNLTVTDSEHFLFSVPLIAFQINYLFVYKPGYLVTILSIIILFLYGGNLRELVGVPVSKWMTATGILGLGNILLLTLCVWLIHRKLDPVKR